MDRQGSYIRNEHGFKMSSSKYTVETISSCVKQNGKINKVFLCHIFSIKSSENFRPFWRTTPNLFILELLSSLYSQHTIENVEATVYLPWSLQHWFKFKNSIYLRVYILNGFLLLLLGCRIKDSSSGKCFHLPEDRTSRA